MNTTPIPELSKEQQTANRLALAWDDMREAMRHLDAHDDLALRQEQQGNQEFADHCEAILSAAIIAYCRPFKVSFSQGHADKSVKAETLDAVQAHRALHDLLQEKRNTFIAHSDWSKRSTTLRRFDDQAIVRFYDMPSVHRGIDLAEFRKLIEEVGRECRKKALLLDWPEAGQPPA